MFVLSVVEELLPFNAERRLEAEVTVALVAEAPGNDKAREILDENYETVREVCRRLVTRLRRAGPGSRRRTSRRRRWRCTGWWTGSVAIYSSAPPRLQATGPANDRDQY